MKELLTEDEIGHSLNENLLREAEEIKDERRVLKERLDRLEETRSQVSDAVYQRVLSDYISKLNKTSERLIALKRDLEAEETTLVGKKNMVEVNTRFHHEKIEESALRYSLGEFTSDQHHELVGREEKEIARLEVALRYLAEGIERHHGIFAGEELVAPERPAPPPPQPPVRVTPPPPPPPASRPQAPAPQQVQAPQPPPPPPPPPKPPTTPSTEHTAKIKLDQHTDQTEVDDLKAGAKATSPSPQRISELLVLDGDKVIQNVPLDRTVVIGRSPSNEVVLKEPKVSRKHAEIQYVGGRYILLDLESSNGTYVAGKRITEQVLQANDEITIGNTKMVFKA